MERKKYTTRRLILRPFLLSDYETWKRSHEIASPAKSKFDKDPWPVSRRSKTEFRKLVGRQNQNAKADRLYVWNLFLRGTGEYVGRLDIGIVERDFYSMANLGYYVINSYWGRGYATEALKELVKRAFKDLSLHRLEASMDLDNKASIKTAKKVGLTREGIKKHYWYQNNRWEDQLVYIATPELYR